MTPRKCLLCRQILVPENCVHVIKERTEAGKRNIYHDPGYWDKRYEKTEGTFDWYTDYRSLK
eukprot:1085456-Amorphochlora_amoeboformis.AAC.2